MSNGDEELSDDEKNILDRVARGNRPNWEPNEKIYLKSCMATGEDLFGLEIENWMMEPGSQGVLPDPVVSLRRLHSLGLVHASKYDEFSHFLVSLTESGAVLVGLVRQPEGHFLRLPPDP